MGGQRIESKTKRTLARLAIAIADTLENPETPGELAEILAGELADRIIEFLAPAARTQAAISLRAYAQFALNESGGSVVKAEAEKSNSGRPVAKAAVSGK